jgi:hypothetical protein
MSAGAGSSSSSGTTYALTGNTSELQKHANHQVRITGRLTGSSSATSGTSTSGTTAGTSASGSSAQPQQLTVDTVTMLAATCTK